MKKDYVLVAYASKYGSTAEIAHKIGETIAKNGTPVDIFEVRDVPELKKYTAVVLGSAVYIGRWRKDAVRFMKIHEKELSEKKVWIFSTGPTGKGEPVKLLEGWDFPSGLKPVAERINPRDITVFHGAVDVSKLNSLHKYMVGKVKVPVGDFRDWKIIVEWAESISMEMR
jgi:menaquinone-dependent protoporphyrinogen oxidase